MLDVISTGLTGTKIQQNVKQTLEKMLYGKYFPRE